MERSLGGELAIKMLAPRNPKKTGQPSWLSSFFVEIDDCFDWNGEEDCLCATAAMVSSRPGDPRLMLPCIHTNFEVFI